MSIFTKDGKLCGNFSPERHHWEAIGRNMAKRYLASDGCSYQDNDRRPDGTIDYDKADLLATKNGKNILIECATKAMSGWSHIKSGVDVELRKCKYLAQKESGGFRVFMAAQDESEAVIIKDYHLALAIDSCGDEFEGSSYYKEVPSSPGFVMPKHECRRLRKYVRQPNGEIGIEDFIRIPFKYVRHLKTEPDGSFRMLKDYEA